MAITYDEAFTRQYARNRECKLRCGDFARELNTH